MVNKTNLTTLTRISKNSPLIRKRNRAITQTLKPIENRLKKRLLLFYNQNIKGSLTPIELLRPRYEKQIHNLVFDTIFHSYLEGRKQVLNQIKNKDAFIQVSAMEGDLGNMMQMKNEHVEQFWKTAGRIKWREAEIQKPELALEAATIGFSAWVTYHSFNKAVVSKSQDVAALYSDKNKIAAVDDEIGIPESRVVFTTAGDSKVDPVFCAPLDGQEFDINDPDLDDATPPLHLHCRCRLVPV